MPSHLSAMPNPSNIPTVVTDYQRQNDNQYAIATGFSNISIEEELNHVENNGEQLRGIKIRKGGVVEMNGKLFKVDDDLTFSYTGTMDKSQIEPIFIELVDNGGNSGTAFFRTATRPGTWDHSRGSAYTKDGARTLNFYTGYRYSAFLNNEKKTQVKILGASYASTSNQKNNTFSLGPGWYIAELISGAGGGDGGDAPQGIENAPLSGPGIGGVPSITNRVVIIFVVEKTKTFTCKIGFNGGAGGRGGVGTVVGNGRFQFGYGGGGGSGAGGSTEIFGLASTGTVPRGVGGRGGPSGVVRDAIGGGSAVRIGAGGAGRGSSYPYDSIGFDSNLGHSYLYGFNTANESIPGYTLNLGSGVLDCYRYNYNKFKSALMGGGSWGWPISEDADKWLYGYAAQGGDHGQDDDMYLNAGKITIWSVYD